MKDGLYHRDIGFPPCATAPFLGRLELWYSRHATQAAAADRYGALDLPQEITIGEFNIVEVEILHGVPIKSVIRMSSSRPGFDLVLVVNRKCENGFHFVRTVWANDAHDNHRTLDRSKYNTV